MNRRLSKYAVALALAVAGTVVATSTGADASAGCPAPKAVAHRGESSLLPEETVQAFVAATEGGANYVEADIRFSKSNTAMLIHDATVTRTTTATGYVSSYYTSSLQALDAGSDFNPVFKNMRIPTFGAGLRAVRPYTGVRFYAEFKTVPTTTQVDIVGKAITDNAMGGRVTIASTDPTTLTRFKTRFPTVPTALISSTATADPVAALKAARASTWHVSHTVLTQANVDAVHAAGMRVDAWTVDTPTGWERMLQMGVDGIMTNKSTGYVGWATSRCGVAP